MFKLPQLQPQLTGTNGIESKKESFLQPFNPSRSGRQVDMDFNATATSAMASFDVKGWERQAREVTTDLTSSDKYKSLALHAEVKLAEALERCERVCSSSFTPTGEEKPNKLKTAVACQLLGEFAELCGPFADVFRTLRDELVKSVYSWYYVTDKGVLSFDQLPWFTVSERLEREKEQMIAERDVIKAQMAAQQEAISRIEEQMAAYKRATEAALLEAASIRSHVQGLTISEEAARTEAKAGREELKKLRKEFIKLQDDHVAEVAAHTKLRSQHNAMQMEFHTQMAEMEQQLEAAQSAAFEARQLAESRVPPEVHEKVKASVAVIQAELDETSKTLKDVEVVKDKLAARLDVMTPRPVWRKVAEHGITTGRRTAEAVHKVEEKLGRYANELSEAQAHLVLAQALLQPEPLPSEVQLTLVTDSSNYFITEQPSVASTSAAATAEPLGLSRTVPRCLRWGERVPLQTWGQAETEAVVADLWRARRNLSLLHDAGTLQTFVYHYFTPDGVTTADTVQRCYSLYNACASHAKASSLVRTFWLVLTGQVSEEAVTDQQRMVSGLSVVLHELPGPALEPSPLPMPSDAPDASISTSDVLACLDAVFPNRPPFRLNKLKEAFRTQFGGGESLSRNVLVLALQPHGLQLPPLGARAARDWSYKADDRLELAQRPQPGPFVQALIGQYLEEVEKVGLEVAAALSGVPTESVPDPSDVSGAEVSGATLADTLSALAGALDQPRALACIMHALGYSTQDGAGAGPAGAASSSSGATQEGTAPGPGDVILPSGLMLEPNDLCRHLLLRCLLKPKGNYDVSGAVQWARATLAERSFGGGEAGEGVEGEGEGPVDDEPNPLEDGGDY